MKLFSFLICSSTWKTLLHVATIYGFLYLVGKFDMASVFNTGHHNAKLVRHQMLVDIGPLFDHVNSNVGDIASQVSLLTTEVKQLSDHVSHPHQSGDNYITISRSLWSCIIIGLCIGPMIGILMQALFQVPRTKDDDNININHVNAMKAIAEEKLAEQMKKFGELEKAINGLENHIYYDYNYDRQVEETDHQDDWATNRCSKCSHRELMLGLGEITEIEDDNNNNDLQAIKAIEEKLDEQMKKFGELEKAINGLENHIYYDYNYDRQVEETDHQDDWATNRCSKCSHYNHDDYDMVEDV